MFAVLFESYFVEQEEIGLGKQIEQVVDFVASLESLSLELTVRL